jgi:hypothetical protein
VKINFDVIEARIKSLVESSTNLVTPNRSRGDGRIPRLAAAVQMYLDKAAIAGETDLPDDLLLEVPVSNMDEWKDFSFKKAMQTILQDAGQTIPTLPRVTVTPSVNLLEGEIFLRRSNQTSPQLDRTASMPVLSTAEEDFLGDAFPANAFIIVNGLETIQVAQSVFNIGRRLENDLVIEDSRISREHAQIRAVKGQFVIFDLNSSGGTFVNSIRVSQQALFPGDVISLAGVPLVYGQDNPPLYAKTGPVETIFNPPQEKEES